MWLAKDKDGVYIYENKPIMLGDLWAIESGYYFEIPLKVVDEILGRNLRYDEAVEIEIRQV